jgi:hypothetical protein
MTGRENGKNDVIKTKTKRAESAIRRLGMGEFYARSQGKSRLSPLFLSQTSAPDTHLLEAENWHTKGVSDGKLQ